MAPSITSEWIELPDGGAGYPPPSPHSDAELNGAAAAVGRSVGRSVGREDNGAARHRHARRTYRHAAPVTFALEKPNLWALRLRTSGRRCLIAEAINALGGCQV